jgi:hypothetical protein
MTAVFKQTVQAESRRNKMMYANNQQNNARRCAGLVLALIGLVSATGNTEKEIKHEN